ncbi:MAG: hypothetical protein AAGI08_04500 [Bacteroidota bacterium]
MTSALPAPLEFNQRYEPKKPAIVLSVLAGAVLGLILMLGAAAERLDINVLSAGFMAFGALMGAALGFSFTAGRWYFRDCQHAFELTPDSLIVYDKKGRSMPVPWKEVGHVLHVKDCSWRFRLAGPNQRTISICKYTHDDKVMRAFAQVVQRNIPEHVSVDWPGKPSTRRSAGHKQTYRVSQTSGSPR